MLLGNRRRHSGGFPISADSLIDILVSVVGFMIVLVLFTVIAGQGKHVVRDVKVTVLAPVLQVTADAPRRRLVLCQRGRASLLDLDDVIRAIGGKNSLRAIGAQHDEQA